MSRLFSLGFAAAAAATLYFQIVHGAQTPQTWALALATACCAALGAVLCHQSGGREPRGFLAWCGGALDPKFFSIGRQLGCEPRDRTPATRLLMQWSPVPAAILGLASFAFFVCLAGLTAKQTASELMPASAAMSAVLLSLLGLACLIAPAEQRRAFCGRDIHCGE